MDLTREILERTDEIPARVALHAAACRFHGAEAVCSRDRHYDAIDGVRRIEPGD